VTAIAFIWAFAEALVFFVLPDFYLLPASAAKPSRWMSLVLACVAGSLCGSVLLFAMTDYAPATIEWALEHLSLTGPSQLARAGALIDRHGLSAFLIQPFSLVPLKLFVYSYAHDGSALLPMIGAVAAGRFLRNIMVAYAGMLIGRRFADGIKKRWRPLLAVYVVVALALVAWAVFPA